ncbi:hypothetical protein HMPREF0322_03031 [Desulfitobacterium hafniense DP7]|uniref:Uncharacterized protein n=1 Tax=Desulfitobacterium hafniense DP7 TaxID=537010 RepID=G9XPY5_DESHA|nr:hypothetical protein HMPREF0322_03031 [Desulfitobacterium hafniense DP7]
MMMSPDELLHKALLHNKFDMKKTIEVWKYIISNNSKSPSIKYHNLKKKKVNFTPYNNKEISLGDLFYERRILKLYW